MDSNSTVTEGETRRRTRLSPAERLPQLLDAGFAEFAAQGFEAARMDAIARRAGAAKGLLYHYFPEGKAALFRAVVRHCLQPVFADAEELIARFDGSRADLLSALIERAYSVLAARERVILKLLIAEAERFPELTEFYHAEVVLRTDALILGVVQDGVARGEFRPEAASWPPDVLLGPVLSASLWRLIFGESHPLDEAALRKAHLEMVLLALRTP